jgi:hypothetical protein
MLVISHRPKSNCHRWRYIFPLAEDMAVWKNETIKMPEIMLISPLTNRNLKKNAGDRKGRPYVHRRKCVGCLRLCLPCQGEGGPPAGGGGIHYRFTRGESSSQP